jgi:hypothetical protein
MEQVGVNELAAEFGIESQVVLQTMENFGLFIPPTGGPIREKDVIWLRLHLQYIRDPERKRRVDEYAIAKKRAHEEWAAWRAYQLANAGQPAGRETSQPGTPDDTAPGALTEPGKVQELLRIWDALMNLAPDPSRAVFFLAKQSILTRAAVDQVRRVRNQCAHPDSKGWPSPYDLDTALTTAREIHRRLVPPRTSDMPRPY